MRLKNARQSSGGGPSSLAGPDRTIKVSEISVLRLYAVGNVLFYLADVRAASVADLFRGACPMKLLFASCERPIVFDIMRKLDEFMKTVEVDSFHTDRAASSRSYIYM